MKVDIYVASESEQPRREERWTGYLIKAAQGEVIEAVSIEGTAYNAVILTIVASLDRFTRPADITLHIESDWIIGRLTRPVKDGEVKTSILEDWQKRGWKTKRGKDVRNKKEWQRLYNKIRVFEHSGAAIRYEKLDKDSRERKRIMNAIRSKIDKGE